MNNLEINIFRFFNSTCHNPILDKIMPYISEIGGGILIFVVALILLVVRSRKAKTSGILLLAGLTCSYNVVYILKNLLLRPRPFLVLTNVNALIVPNGYSMPSTHAAMVFMAAYVLAKEFGNVLFFLTLAVLVGISRIYLGVHFPSDVIVGAGIGLLIGHLLYTVAEQTRLYD